LALALWKGKRFHNKGGHLMEIPIIITGLARAAGSSDYDYVTFAD